MSNSPFAAEQLQKCSREMAGNSGIEKTPDEWDAMFRQMIRDYRGWHPETTDGMDDGEVWGLIHAMITA